MLTRVCVCILSKIRKQIDSVMGSKAKKQKTSNLESVMGSKANKNQRCKSTHNRTQKEKKRKKEILANK